MTEIIPVIKIECGNVSAINSYIDPQGEPKLKVLLEDVPAFELMCSIIAKIGVDEVLNHIVVTDIEKYLKESRDNGEGVTVTVKGVDNVFMGDELTSPAQQAFLFMSHLVKHEELF
jgi:hypothetical protein